MGNGLLTSLFTNQCWFSPPLRFCWSAILPKMECRKNKKHPAGSAILVIIIWRKKCRGCSLFHPGPPVTTHHCCGNSDFAKQNIMFFSGKQLIQDLVPDQVPNQNSNFIGLNSLFKHWCIICLSYPSVDPKLIKRLLRANLPIFALKNL